MAECKYPNEACINQTIYHEIVYCDSIPCSLKYEFPKQTEIDIIKSIMKKAISKLEILSEYEKIGTVEECRDAREKQIQKKIIHNQDGGVCKDWLCPSCGKFCNPYSKFCINCGQRLLN